MADTEAGTAGKQQKRGEGRSPAYPFIPVQKALDRVQELYARENTHYAPLTSAMKAWGYSPKSSGARQTLATMRYYGLVDVSGEGDDRMVRVSESARQILLDKREDSTEKRKLVRQVALMPSAHKSLFQEYPDGLPSDGTVHHFLVFRKGYNDAAANELLAEFKQTASYVGLYEPDKSVDNGDEQAVTEEARVELPTVKVGDRIQCTVNGVDQFPDGATVLGISEDGRWAFTDQSRSGVPLKDATIMDAPALERPAEMPPQVPAHLLAATRQEEQAKGTRKAVFPLDEGDVSLTFPEGLSPTGLQDLSDYLAIFLKKEARKKRADDTAELLGKLEGESPA